MFPRLYSESQSRPRMRSLASRLEWTACARYTTSSDTMLSQNSSPSSLNTHFRRLGFGGKLNPSMAGIRSSSRKSGSERPVESHRVLQPSQEVQAKMGPLARASFERVLQRAAQPVRPRASKAK